MAKQIVIRKHKDKIVLSIDDKPIADIVVAKSSRTESVNLSIQANLDVKIEKHELTERKSTKRIPPHRAPACPSDDKEIHRKWIG